MSKVEKILPPRKFEIDMRSSDFCPKSIHSKGKEMGASDLFGMELRFLAIDHIVHVFSPQDNYVPIVSKLLKEADLLSVAAGVVRVKNGIVRFEGISKDVIFNGFTIKKSDSDSFLMHKLLQYTGDDFDLAIVKTS